MSHKMIKTIDGLVDALGAERLGNVTGIGRTGVAMWSTRSSIPKGWHLLLAIEIKRDGLLVDPDLLDLSQEQLDIIMSVTASPARVPSVPARSRRVA